MIETTKCIGFGCSQSGTLAGADQYLFPNHCVAVAVLIQGLVLGDAGEYVVLDIAPTKASQLAFGGSDNQQTHNRLGRLVIPATSATVYSADNIWVPCNFVIFPGQIIYLNVFLTGNSVLGSALLYFRDL